MAAPRMDRWWAILIAFAVALGMVLLVMLAMSSSPADGATPKVKPAPVSVGRHHPAGPDEARHGLTKRDTMSPAPPSIVRKDSPLWTVGILATAGAVTLVILMLAIGR